jgi:glycosyltransferase involved in cell wall biosynthesis
VATLNRLDMLERCVAHALAQTRPPVEIVVADASDGWEAHRVRIRELVEARAELGVRLTYLGHPVRSLTSQRNAALRALSADVAFMIDDDSLMEPDCAETVMALYEADPEGRVAGIAGVNVAVDGATAGAAAGGAALKEAGSRRSRAMRRGALTRWILKEVLLQSRDRIFLRYDPPGTHHGRAAAEALGLPGTRYTEFLPGWGMTVRRRVALLEPFDDGLLAYCPTEDLDASYRWGRHGVCLVAENARIAHVEVAAGRLKRQKVTALSVMNSAYLTRRNSDRPGRDAARYYLLGARRVVAELLKDLLMSRLTLPQARGAVRGLLRTPAIFLHPREGLGPWYAERQGQVLAW